MNLSDPDGEKRTKLAILRNNLASERNFLAWIRTGLAGIAGGFAIIRLLTYQTYFHEWVGYIVGLSFIFWGIFLFLFALHDYESNVTALKSFDPSLEIPLFSKKMIIISLLICSFLILIILV